MYLDDHAVTPDRMREIENFAIEQAGVPSFLLMEHAAIAVVDEAEKMLAEKWNPADTGQIPQVLFVCGTGNNGGDGMAAARIHTMRGGASHVVLVGDRSKLKGDAKRNFELLTIYQIGFTEFDGKDCVLKRSGIMVNVRVDLIVDAILGIGLSGTPGGEYRDAIFAINNLSAENNVPVLAVDIPSGVDAANGNVYVDKEKLNAFMDAAVAVYASRTVTFAWAKPGHFLFPGRDYCGGLIIKPIGLPDLYGKDCKKAPLPDGPCLLSRAVRRTEMIINSIKREKRNLNTHKGDYGHVLIIAGSLGMAGAAAMCAKAALAAGAGLVTVACPQIIAPIIQTLAPCAMAYGLPEKNGVLSIEAAGIIPELLEGKSAIAIGPGLGKAPREILWPVLASGVYCVIDADAIRLLKDLISESERTNETQNIDESQKIGEKFPQLVITPHPGEFAYLTGKTIGEIVSDPIKAAIEFSKKHGMAVLLKGATTVIAADYPYPPVDDMISYIGTLGTPGMATGGSGDVLTGILAATIAKDEEKRYGGASPKYPAYSQIASSYIIHALAGEAASRKKSDTAMTAMDIIDSIPEVFKDISIDI